MGARTNSDQCLSVGREAFSGKSGRGVAHKVYRTAKLCRGGSWMVAWRQHLASRVDRSCRWCSHNLRPVCSHLHSSKSAQSNKRNTSSCRAVADSRNKVQTARREAADYLTVHINIQLVSPQKRCRLYHKCHGLSHRLLIVGR